jgi:hypothetical protein
MLINLTEQSIKSAWAEKEVETAFEKEQRQHQTVLFPDSTGSSTHPTR